jgi:hypothetical protein
MLIVFQSLVRSRQASQVRYLRFTCDHNSAMHDCIAKDLPPPVMPAFNILQHEQKARFVGCHNSQQQHEETLVNEDISVHYHGRMLLATLQALPMLCWLTAKCMQTRLLRASIDYCKCENAPAMLSMSQMLKRHGTGFWRQKAGTANP